MVNLREECATVTSTDLENGTSLANSYIVTRRGYAPSRPERRPIRVDDLTMSHMFNKDV